MLITCPQCLTNYDVPSVLEETGQKVKCVKCGCVWEIDDATVEPEAEDLPNFDDEAIAFDPAPAAEIGEPDIPMPAFQDFFKPPEKKEPDFSKWIRPLYFVSLFCIAASIYLFFFRSPARAPVTLQTLAYESVQEEYKTYLVLHAAAFNNTDKEVIPEMFNVRFSDENGRLLTATDIASPVSALPARGMGQIDLKIERPPSHTAQASVTLTKFTTR